MTTTQDNQFKIELLHGNTYLVKVENELTVMNARELQVSLKDKLDRNSILILDCLNLDYVDSTGLGILLYSKKSFKDVIIVANKEGRLCEALIQLSLFNSFKIVVTIKEAVILAKGSE